MSGAPAQPSSRPERAAEAASRNTSPSGTSIATSGGLKASWIRRTAVSRIRSRDKSAADSRSTPLTSASWSLRSRSAAKATEFATAIESWPAKRVRYSRSSSVNGGEPGRRVAFSTP